MTTAPPSPKRRHILSSINPQERRSASPRLEGEHPNSTAPPHDDEGPEQAATDGLEEKVAGEKKSTRFRFKSKSSRSSHDSSHRRHRERDYDEDRDRDRHSSSHRHRRHHHRHRRRRSRSPTPPNPYDPPPLDPEAAFRESLFDAMADDEGASYWEGVYGQPIHVYSRAQASPAGELEQMTDDEYAAYVRQKMWEKTHAGILEERAAREQKRKEKEQKEDEARRLTREMEESLLRGEERRRRKQWKDHWTTYVDAWAKWDTAASIEGINWPVESQQMDDVTEERVRDFFIKGIDPTEVGETGFLAKLKDERVRWHPDKMQQKLGGQVDEKVMRAVTAVFQIIDKLWSDTRPKKS